MTLMRLQRALARAGVASRRKAEDLIRAGRVRVDGETATIGMSVDPDAQKLTVDGRPVRSATRTTWLDRKSTRLNSSHGYISYAVFCLKKKKIAKRLGAVLSAPGDYHRYGPGM